MPSKCISLFICDEILGGDYFPHRTLLSLFSVTSAVKLFHNKSCFTLICAIFELRLLQSHRISILFTSGADSSDWCAMKFYIFLMFTVKRFAARLKVLFKVKAKLIYFAVISLIKTVMQLAFRNLFGCRSSRAFIIWSWRILRGNASRALHVYTFPDMTSWSPPWRNRILHADWLSERLFCCANKLNF